MSLADPSPLQPFLDKLVSRSGLGPAERQAILDLPARPAQIGTNRDFVRLGERVHHACFVVAGLVGELLTELFLLGRPPLARVASELRELSRAFGEGLQLVNIIKDSASDAKQGRRYLPPDTGLGEVLALARRDLQAASQYVLALQRAGAERGLVAFVALPVRLATATLDRIEQAGPGSKLTRPEVYAIVQRMNRALDHDEPAVA